MAFTILFALFALLGFGLVFGITYKIKGMKAAFITTGIAFFLLAILYVAAINLITAAM